MSRRSKYTIEFERRFGDKVKSRSIPSLAKHFKIKKSILQDVLIVASEHIKITLPVYAPV